MVGFRLVAIAFLAMVVVPAVAQTPPPNGAPGFQPLVAPPAMPMSVPSVAAQPGVTTSRGAGLVTGGPGAPQMIMIPGSAVPGMMLNNGNGTSSIMVPGGATEVVPTPR